MLVEKKYLTPEYICSQCIGLLRYNPIEKNNDSLKCVGNFLNYFFTNKNNPYTIISKVYETDNLVYLRIFGDLVLHKLTHPLTNEGELKQHLINQIEGKIDNNSFTKAHKFINYIIDNILNPKFNNGSIDIEFDKCTKYILLNDSINNLTKLYNNFYAEANSYEHYESVLAGIFNNYEEGIVNDDFVIGNEEEDISEALTESAVTQEEVRTVSLLSDIRFLEKKRIAIMIGASGAGKSMFLCHATAEYLQNTKLQNRKSIIFYFTFENSKAETFLRIVANITGIEIDQLKSDILDPVKKKNIMQLYLKRKDPNTILVISELPPKRHSMTTLEAIIDKTLLRYTDAEVYGVMIDYVDKMLPVSNNSKLRTDESLGLIVDDFKALVKTYNTCGITVSQFNRDGAKKARSDDEMATATDIGGGWSKYENADVVITMQVKNTYEELGHNIVVLVNEKHRYYRDGTVIDCIYKPQFAKFLIGNATNGGAMAGQFAPAMDTTEADVFSQTAIF